MLNKLQIFGAPRKLQALAASQQQALRTSYKTGCVPPFHDMALKTRSSQRWSQLFYLATQCCTKLLNEASRVLWPKPPGNGLPHRTGQPEGPKLANAARKHLGALRKRMRAMRLGPGTTLRALGGPGAATKPLSTTKNSEWSEHIAWVQRQMVMSSLHSLYSDEVGTGKDKANCFVRRAPAWEKMACAHFFPMLCTVKSPKPLQFASSTLVHHVSARIALRWVGIGLDSPGLATAAELAEICHCT